MQRNWISIFGTDLRMTTDNLISVWSVWVLIFSWSTQISNISIFKYCWNECQFWVESRALKKDNYLSFYFSWLKSITGFHHAFHCLRYHSSDLVLFLCKKSSEWSSSSGGICRFFFFFCTDFCWELFWILKICEMCSIVLPKCIINKHWELNPTCEFSENLNKITHRHVEFGQGKHSHKNLNGMVLWLWKSWKYQGILKLWFPGLQKSWIAIF